MGIRAYRPIMSPLLRRYLPVALAAGLLAGCASSSSSRFSRIDANRGLYESWPLEVQEAILMERVIEGMTEEMVYMAMGKPDDVQIRVTAQGYQDIWVYKIRRDDGGGGGMSGGMGGPSIGIGVGSGGVGGVHVGAPPIIMGGGGSPLPPSENIIIFENGRVTGVRMDI